MKDIFKILVAEDKINNSFKSLVYDAVNEPARILIEEIANTFHDKDGNFIKDFQSTGFIGRLWELFLFQFLKENNFETIEDVDYPDFHVKKLCKEFFIEATTTNPAKDDEYTDDVIDKAQSMKDKKIEKELSEYYIRKIGSSLKSKLELEYKNGLHYWELEKIKGQPFVFAILPAHNKLAYFFPDSNIIEYLYGIKYLPEIDSEGHLNGNKSFTLIHNYRGKEIPSNFFKSEIAKNISAVFFSNTCDIHKFNRIGYQNSLSAKDLIICRAGHCYNTEPYSTAKEFTKVTVKGMNEENWSEGVSMLHNPNAYYPLDPLLFSGIRQIWQNDNGDLVEYMPSFFPFNSITNYALIQ
jgi:hypothetical protein